MGILYFDYEKDEFSAVMGMLSIFKNALEEWFNIWTKVKYYVGSKYI